jgi:hypothetical protein
LATDFFRHRRSSRKPANTKRLVIASTAPATAAATIPAIPAPAATTATTTTAATASITASPAVATATESAAATTTTESTATAAATAAESTATAAASAFFAGSGNINGQVAAAEVLAVIHINRALSLLGRRKLDEREPTRFTGNPVHHQVNRRHDACPGEMVVNVSFQGLER